ncbi:DNA-processing protein DprA [Nocardiopsis sp. NPDC006938]|uniref:DNA-processing protein DprA n=1 Tax=Nocardiopsis sp. NPDC006938 TaxID=3364337 RepID=UPI00369B6716
MHPIDERTAMLALLLRRGARRAAVTDEVMEAGSASSVLERTLLQDSLFPQLIEQAPEVVEARSLIESCGNQGVRVLSFTDSAYPDQLRDIHEMPPVVFTRGTLHADPRAIAVVGSRKASEHGLRMAYNIASRLADMNVTVVSGLAEGVDTAAHRAALDRGGRTVAVMGTGIDRYYPAKNRDLQDEIATRGMLLSQFLPGSPPTKASFPMRNAVMSGYAAATIVVEAGEHSGARIQARYALQHGRPLIFPRELLVNQWAREFATRPGVHVVDNMVQTIATVESRLRDAATTAADITQQTDFTKEEAFAW